MNPVSRREFIGRAAALAALPAMGQESPSGEVTISGVGELLHRIQLAQRRMTSTEHVPVFTKPFVLADVTLDPKYPRRFSEFSGDLSGRYIGALAILPPALENPRLADLVREIVLRQHPDGRFGNPKLSFDPQDIAGDQMALLWGNGRLLVGLLEYCEAHPSADVLDCSRRLGEFLLSVQQRCAEPAVARRLEGLGAMGLICFTQLIEGLVLLGRRTGERRYYEAASRIVPSLGPRGNQHSHGYLTTLRGVLALHEATADPEHLRFVEDRVTDLLSSDDYTVSGGVYEYFGKGPRNAQFEYRGNDEGCSEADLLRLLLRLWHATGKLQYLEAGERCLLNAFYYNQFRTGDFGHHTSFRYGFKPTQSVGRAWWCCTMHGLRAFRDVIDTIVTERRGGVAINLLNEGICRERGIYLTMRHGTPEPGGISRYVIRHEADSAGRIPVAIRRPAWASDFAFSVNREHAAPDVDAGYSVLSRNWRKGDTIELLYRSRIRLQTREGRQLQLSELGAGITEAAVSCGPRLLAVDSELNPEFFGEPWMGDNPRLSNVLLVPPSLQAGHSAAVSGPFSQPEARLRVTYRHGGWPETHTAVMRPISEQTGNEPQTVAFWLNVSKG